MSDMLKLPSGTEKSFKYGNTTYVNRGPELGRNGKRTGLYIYTKATSQEIVNRDIMGYNLTCTWTKLDSLPAPGPIATYTPSVTGEGAYF